MGEASKWTSLYSARVWDKALAGVCATKGPAGYGRSV